MKNRIRRLIWLLGLFVLSGCSEEIAKEEEKSKETVEENLAAKITWKTDGSEMVLIPAGSFEMGDHFGDMTA